MKLAQISDIHIRLYKRHDEFKLVFDDLYKQLKTWKQQNPDSLIIVTGDIVHSKTELSPETVELVSDFFTNLSYISKTLVIAGNHDANLANPSRLDSLSPILSNIPYLEYLRNSQIYTVGDVDFAICSIFDSADEWPSVSDCRSKTKVALYHGPVATAETDAGYVMSERCMPIEVFDGYDFVLLGDIHKFQILKDSNPLIAYAGSLVQQNYGETLAGHGWAEWDLDAKTVIHHEVKNPYGYITLVVKDTKNISVPQGPEKIRLRLFVDDVDSADTTKLAALLRKDYNLVELSINKNYINKDKSAKEQLQAIVDVHDASQQNELIEKYLKSKFVNIDSDVLDNVLKINERLNTELSHDELPRNITWKPKLLKFDNLFSYGEGNVINFESLDGLCGLFSPNATGKTSAFDALCFALYDKTPRASRGIHIMNTRAQRCYCELHLEIDGEDFRIIRKGGKKKTGEVKIDVDFMKKDGDKWTSLNGGERRDTNSIIRSYIGDYSDFVLTNLSVQNQNSVFIETGQADRKDLLNQFMGLTIFDKLNTLASDEIKDIAAQLKAVRGSDHADKLVQVQRQLEEVEKEYTNLQIEISHQQFVHDATIGLIKKALEQKVPNIKISETSESLQNKIKQYELIVDDIAREKQLTLESLSARGKEWTNIGTHIGFLIPCQFSNPEDLYKNLVNQISENRLQNAKAELNYKHCIDRLLELDKEVYNLSCNVCVEKHKNIISEKEKFNVLKKELSDEINILADNFITLSAEAKIVQDDLKLAQEWKEWNNKYIEIRRLIKDDQKKLEALEITHNSNHKELLMYKDALQQYEENKKIIEQNRKLDNEIVELERLLKNCNAELDKLHQRTKTVYGRLEVLKVQKTEVMEMIKKLEELETIYEAYEYYLTATNRDGIPYQLISETLPSLESSANNTLGQMVDFRVKLELDGKNINAFIVYDDFRKWPLELASGMEKFVTGLAIRTSLMSISSLPRSNFLIVDEGFGVLDGDNLISIFSLFAILKNQFDFIILVSHLTSIKDIVDNLIEIKREDGYSYIKVV